MRVSAPVQGVRLSLWRAAAVFRVIGLALCLYLLLRWQPIYARPALGLLAGAAMLAWTAVIVAAALRGRAHHVTLVAADVVVTAALTVLSIPVQTTAQHLGGMVTLTTLWAAGPAVGAGILAGPVGGITAGLVQMAAALVVREGYDGRTLYSATLLVVTGASVGLVAHYLVRAEADLRAAAAAQAALAERERLARSIHDGVLQVLGLVHRTGRDAGPPWTAIAAAAGEQEAALRALVTSQPADAAGDLGAALRALRSETVTVSTPAEALPWAGTGEVRAAVAAALHNVTRHAGAGAHAWILLEALDGEFRVTVRDDGAGMASDRIAEAEREGRLGVARSIRGRLEALGGTTVVRTAPGEGTEIVMTVPR